MEIAAIYLGLVALLFTSLSVQVVRYRRSKWISLGDANDPRLLQLVRAHSNCAEYAPIGILLLAAFEFNGAPDWAVHCMGLCFLAGRVLHAVAFSGQKMIMALRVWGMVLTFTQAIITALWVLILVIV